MNAGENILGGPRLHLRCTQQLGFSCRSGMTLLKAAAQSCGCAIQIKC